MARFALPNSPEVLLLGNIQGAVGKKKYIQNLIVAASTYACLDSGKDQTVSDVKS